MVNCFQGLHNIVVLVMFNCKFTLTHESVLLNSRYSVAEFQQITTVLFYSMIWYLIEFCQIKAMVAL